MSNLSIFTAEEQQAFDYPPALSVEIRALCFAIDQTLEKELARLRTSTNKVGFLLQYAYFKACKRFFFMSRFRQEDIDYTLKLLGLAKATVDLASYKKKIPTDHQKKILSMLGYKPFDVEISGWLEKEIYRQVDRQNEPKQIFIHVINLLTQNKIEIPSYHCISELITDVYLKFENKLLAKLKKNLTKKNKDLLDTLLKNDNPSYPIPLNQLKFINQSTKPKAIQAGLATFETIKTYFLPLNPVLDALNLSQNCGIYYATWVQKAKLSQLTQFPEKEKLYFHLLAFIQHQFYLRQDYFVDITLKHVQSTKNTASKQLNEADQLTRAEKRKAIRHLTKSNKSSRTLIDEISRITKSSQLSDSEKIVQVNALLNEYEKQQNEKEQNKIKLLEDSLDRMEKDKDYYDILEKLSVKLQLRISDILKALIFNAKSSDKQLLAAIEHFITTDGQIKSQAPIEFLSADEREVLFDDNKKIRASLYKVLLFIHVASAIKSGELNLQYSYRYKAIQDYLIDETTWKKERDQLIKAAQLEQFSDYDALMTKLKKCLEDKYQFVNTQFMEGRNPYLSINKDGKVHVTTPAIEEKETKYIASLLEQSGFIPAFQVLADIERIVNITTCFKHHSNKHVKQRPNINTFFAGVIGLGCNIGTRKMAQISVGVKENTLVNTVNWYFSLTNLHKANQRIIEMINKLSLSGIFVHDKLLLHSSGDGSKFNVSVDSLIANASFKYHGKDKGVSVYAFIDERQSLFHSLVMSSSEREAPYVIDGLLQNDVVKTSIHSTDTHGFTETIFAATHFLDVAFAPRIKNVGKQRIYAFSTKETYEKRGYKILPSRPINQKLIAKHWDDILRFMVTIKLKQVTASQLFSRP